MLEVGWSELLVIAIILIVVVGPKDLPAMMRTFGRVMGRVRTMANEFRGQFDEAMREAELDDVRKGLGEVNKYNPANTIRDAMNPIRQLGQDIKADLQKASSIPAATKTEGTPVAELSSDPAVAPEPVVQSSPEPAKVEPAAVAAAKPQPAASVQPAAITAPAAVTEPAPAAERKPARAKKATGPAGDYPPPEKKVVKRKAPAPHVDHDVHVVAEPAKPRTAGKAVPKADTAVGIAPGAKPATRKKTAKTSDA